MIDLHCHTTASDGTLGPEELVALAAAAGLHVIAVTDHDTVDGVARACSAAEHHGIRLVPGIELSTEEGGRSAHVLGYFLNPASTVLVSRLESLRIGRLERAEKIVERLNELGYEITFDEVLAQTGGRVVGRPHIARTLVAREYIASVRDAFTPELLANGGRAYVPAARLTAVEGIELIRAAGGAPVLAHPAVGHHDAPEGPVPVTLIEALADHGLAGLEVDHPDQAAVREDLRRLADRLGLVVTGGTDFHGEHGNPLGTCSTSPENLERLKAAAI